MFKYDVWNSVIIAIITWDSIVLHSDCYAEFGHCRAQTIQWAFIWFWFKKKCGKGHAVFWICFMKKERTYVHQLFCSFVMKSTLSRLIGHRVHNIRCSCAQFINATFSQEIVKKKKYSNWVEKHSIGKLFNSAFLYHKQTSFRKLKKIWNRKLKASMWNCLKMIAFHDKNYCTAFTHNPIWNPDRTFLCILVSFKTVRFSLILLKTYNSAVFFSSYITFALQQRMQRFHNKRNRHTLSFYYLCSLDLFAALFVALVCWSIPGNSFKVSF